MAVPNRSLIVALLSNIVLRVGLVVFIASIFTYIHLTEAATKQFLGQLTLYASEHAARESDIFKLADDNVHSAETIYRDKLAALQKTSPEPAFSRAFARWSDGTVRDAPADHAAKDFPFDKKPGTFIGKNVVLTDDFKRRALAAQEVAQMLGPAWKNRFVDFYVMTPENSVSNFWPTLPWTHQATADLDMRQEEYFYVSDKTHNKTRNTAWTGLYYDAVARDWMVSSIRPIDAPDGRHIASIGVDILVNDIIARTTREAFTGTYSFLVAPDGRLIAHPKKMDSIRKKEGKLFVAESGDPVLIDIYNAINGKPDGMHKVESRGLYVVSYKLDKVGWSFVTVVPRQIIADYVFDNTRLVFFTGIALLLAELLILGMVISGYIVKPLRRLINSVEGMERGEATRHIEGEGARGEVATLINGYNSMIETIQNRESELRGALHKADSANRTKTDFLANMSHELRTPLNSIIGMAQLLRDQHDFPAADKQRAETIYESAASLLGIVSDILDVAKLESGDMTPDIAPFKPESSIDRMEMILKPLADAKGIILQQNVDAAFDGLTISGDNVRFARVLSILASNAIKYTQKGRIDIIGIYSELTADTANITIKVIDTGIGISEDKIERIFDKFEQADTSTTRRFGGLGLGLSIARDMVEMMGGTIWVKSVLGKGSEFTFTVPAKIVSRKVTKALLSANENRQTPLADARVLVAEDHKLNIALLEQLLRSFGLKDFDIVENGRAAVEAFASKKYHAVLMDCHMPEMDGYEATMAIRLMETTNGQGARIPIIALTADVVPENVERCHAAGMDEFMAKPFDIAKIKALLGRWIDFGKSAA